METGKVGELLVQTRLLQYGVQAAAPLIDSGNDLIAVRGEVFKGVQIKTTAKNNLHWNNLPEHYHILALVDLAGEEDEIFLDASSIYLVPRNEVGNINPGNGSLEKFRISKILVEQLFNDTQ